MAAAGFGHEHLGQCIHRFVFLKPEPEPEPEPKPEPEHAPAEQSWSAEQGAGWLAALDRRLAEERCAHCGGGKITKHIRGRPMAAHVDWAAAKSAELGWMVVEFAGCTNPGGSVCVECGKDPSG